MKQGGVRVENVKVDSPDASVDAARLAGAGDGGVLLSAGRKRHGVVRVK
jgi:hypothetical protein